MIIYLVLEIFAIVIKELVDRLKGKSWAATTQSLDISRWAGRRSGARLWRPPDIHQDLGSGDPNFAFRRGPIPPLVLLQTQGIWDIPDEGDQVRTSLISSIFENRIGSGFIELVALYTVPRGFEGL